ncbi:MAG: beta-glucosidase [Promethearchaeota archaeon]
MENLEIKKGLNKEEIEQLVEKLLNQMTFEEKVYQMSGNGFFKYIVMDRKFGARAYPAGGVKRLGIPPFRFTDGPRGVIIPGSTCFPVSMARAASWDTNLEERVGEVIGKEVRAHGGNLFGGVCINLLRHPGWGRAQETYGEDTFLLGEFGAALVRGVQKHNVMATIKHFAANSIEFTRFKVNVEMDERTLREVYLPHFKRCIEEGSATVMSAYNKFRGEYCGHNSYLLRNIVKGDWGFEGFIHSDWMYGLRNTIAGITGGLDVEMPRVKHYRKIKLKRAIQKGEVSMELINDAARRVIKTILRFTTKKDPQAYSKDIIACEDHIKISREVAEKSMVLLKNERATLPLNLQNIKTLALIGRLADLKNTGDHGSSRVRQEKVVTPLQGFTNFLGDSVNIVYNSGKDLDTAKNIALSSDAVVLIIGYTYKDEGEYIKEFKVGGDRTNLGLRPHDIQLIQEISKVNPKCIVVLIGGSAIIMEEWKDCVPAILMAWYSGMEGGNALASIIFGKVNPSGKLPFTIPRDPSDLPLFDTEADEVEYGYYHGYTLMEKENIEPAFPFGFGLSYTGYKYENLKVEVLNDEIIVRIDVSNIGSRAGEEVVQVYVGFEQSKINRPNKLLKGFTKMALNPQETKTALIKIKKKDLKWYNPKTKSWEFEKIPYTIYAGPSSKNEELLKSSITL